MDTGKISKTNYHFPVKIKRIESLRSPEIAIKYTTNRRSGLIHEQFADSFAEWVIALALWYLEIPFIYKFQIPRTKVFIDFFIDVGLDWIPWDVYYFEEYEETSEKRFRRKIIEWVFNHPLIVIWNYQVSTFEEAITTIKRVIFEKG